MNYSRAGEQLSSVGHHEALKQPPAVHQECVTKSSNHFAHSGSPAAQSGHSQKRPLELCVNSGSEQLIVCAESAHTSYWNESEPRLSAPPNRKACQQ